MTGAAVALSDPNGVASDTVTIQNKTNLSGNQDGIDLTVPGTITVNTTDIDNNTSAAIRQTAGRGDSYAVPVPGGQPWVHRALGIGPKDMTR